MANYNIFEQNAQSPKEFTTEDQKNIINDAKRLGSLRDAILAHANDGNEALDNYIAHGVDVEAPTGFENISYPGVGLPNYTKAPGEMPWINIRSAWVTKVLSGCTKSPFTYVKNPMVDIRADAARAQGYIKGQFKKESFIKMLQRKTSPCTYYVKQDLEEEDIADITEFSVVDICRRAMQIKSDEELARAIIVGDGRPALLDNGDPNPDKINEDCIRPILTDVDTFVISGTVSTLDQVIDKILALKETYQGSGNLTCFMNYADYAALMVKRDEFGHRMYKTSKDLADEMGVREIIDVPFITSGTILAVDLADYMIGGNAKMNNASWDQFDLNFNKRLYLLENRKSGALYKPFSAIKVTVTE